MSKSFDFCGWKSFAIFLVKMIVTLACGIATLYIPLSLKDEGMVWYQPGQGPNAEQWVQGQGATPNTNCHIIMFVGVCLMVALILWGLIKQPKDD